MKYKDGDVEHLTKDQIDRCQKRDVAPTRWADEPPSESENGGGEKKPGKKKKKTNAEKRRAAAEAKAAEAKAEHGGP